MGLIAAGLALSLRTGTPNLAVGSIAAATGVVGTHLASTDGWSLWTAMAAAVALAAATGFVAGLIVGGLSVPAWAVTLAVALLAQAAALAISGGQPVVLHGISSYPATLWLAVFAAVSIGGGALWLVPGVRTALSATRHAGDPGRRAGLPAGLGALAGLTGSSLLAGLGGVSLATYLQVSEPSSDGINLTLLALAAVLVGGVSVFGRRAGVFGTVLGVLIAQTLVFLLNVHAVSLYWLDAAIGGLAIVGLFVNRVMESITDTLS
jgi:ribose/xylose/arabinose/galactoside ABC-type transport system permease subunit